MSSMHCTQTSLNPWAGGRKAVLVRDAKTPMLLRSMRLWLKPLH